MASELVPIAKIKKPEDNKVSAISQTDVDTPQPVGTNAQIEIYSNMGRERTGIQESHQRWGDRLFSAEDSFHPCSKPQDWGMNPAYTERQRRFMGAELGRKRAGQETETGMTTEELRDFAAKPVRHKKHRRHNPY